MSNINVLHIENSKSVNDSRSANNHSLAIEAVEEYFSMYQI
jgi:hypothetical protein